MLYSMFLYCFSIPTDVVAEIVSPDIPRNCRGNFATLLQQKKKEESYRSRPRNLFLNYFRQSFADVDRIFNFGLGVYSAAVTGLHN